VSSREKTAISDALLERFRRSSHYRPSFRDSGRNGRRPGVWAWPRFSSKKEACLQGLCASMFPAVATGAEREEILERVRSWDRMVDGEACRGAAADAAVAVSQPRRPPQLLPGRAIELRARGARALGPLACVAPPLVSAERIAPHSEQTWAKTIPSCSEGNLELPTWAKILAVTDISEAYGSVWTSQARVQSRLSARAKGSRAFLRFGSPRFHRCHSSL
jgi:hypothetical protein